MMLIDLTKLHGIYLVCGRTDLRRGIDGLAAVVTQQYELDLYSKSLFMLCFVELAKIVSRHCFGTATDFYCFTNALRMADFNGQLIRMR
jgi:hypothetical protein